MTTQAAKPPPLFLPPINYKDIELRLMAAVEEGNAFPRGPIAGRFAGNFPMGRIRRFYGANTGRFSK